MIAKPSPATRFSASALMAAPNPCGLFAERLNFEDFSGRPALFLDRDGVIVEETNYLHRPDEVRMLPGAASAIAAVNRAAIPVVIVTNQAGIGRGYYDWKDFHAVQSLICNELEKVGARSDMVIACAYHENGVGEYACDDHPWRKPQPGMLIEAAARLGIDLPSSFIVGDCLTDIQAGARAGLRTGAMVETGHGKGEWDRAGPQTFHSLKADFGFEASLFPSASGAIKAWLATSP